MEFFPRPNQMFIAKLALYGWTTLLISVLPLGGESKIIPKKLSNDFYTLDLRMPSVVPHKKDDYLCTAVNVSGEELYITQFEPDADVGKIHHMIIFGCENILSRSNLYPNSWPCLHSNLCAGMQILYAWGRNAPTLTLPKDVGFHVGQRSRVNFLVLQAHYANPLEQKDSSGIRLLYTLLPQPNVAGIFLLASDSGVIPPNKKVAHVDMNCRLGRSGINIFAYRVHTHALGTVVSGYKYSRQPRQWTLLAKGNPQWPQAFYPLGRVVPVPSQDILAARCTFDSSARSTMTRMGSTADDEMCNLYLMYYSENLLSDARPLNADMSSMYSPLSQKRPTDDVCQDEEFTNLGPLPQGNDVPLPRNQTLEEWARGQNSIHKSGHFEHRTHPAQSGIIRLVLDRKWPMGANQFGQVTAVDVDSSGNLVIFHRGAHVWNELSFDLSNHYKPINAGPISTPTVVVISPSTRQVLHQWGSDLFYLPHGLTIHGDSIWLTDVALHQVFKFPLQPSSANHRKALLTLGERFVPGSDTRHFCKPTSVAVDGNTGDFYVADGYCNSRIIRFDKSGNYKNHWGHAPVPQELSQQVQPANVFAIPHKVVLVEFSAEELLACVADRENGRIQCFTAPYGTFKFQIKIAQFNGRLFSIAYSKRQRTLYAVSGPSLFEPGRDVLAFAFSIDTRKLVGIFGPQSGTFTQPHDIAVSHLDDSVFVVEIGPNNIWKFSREDQPGLSESEEHPENSGPKVSPGSGPGNSVIKAKIIESQVFGLEMLQIRSKQFRDSISFNQLLFVVLFLLFLFIIVSHIRYTRQSPLHFCVSLSHFICGSICRRKYLSAGSSSERIHLGNIFTDRDRKLKQRGFNRLPLNEEESELQINDDEDDDGDLSDVLEDFNLTRAKQGIV